MAKLFIFGIGGTGSRVLKSLSMLLATGVDFGEYIDEIVPIIIDVDKSNEDLTRTIEILKNYEAVHSAVAANRANYKGFFQTKQTNLYPLNGNEYRLTIEDVQGKTFGQYIDYQTLTGAQKDLANLLFSGSQEDRGLHKPLLDMDMAIGFQGHPKLGCVVLNQFKGNRDFDTFAENFAPGDRIFIISSIHGGTGAAGFPLLLKNLRNANVPTPNSAHLNNALIGATTVLPYFQLKEGDIKSADFISKTKAALQYYLKNVNPSLNSMYYIGNSTNTHNYENNKGGINQKNEAHFIEFAAAMSVVDFANQDINSIALQGKRFMEFGVNNFTNAIDLSVLGEVSKKMIHKPLAQYHFFKMYLDNQLRKSINCQPWSNRGKIKITKDFINPKNGFYQILDTFNQRFDEWTREMADNDPKFVPFNKGAGLLHSISNISHKNSTLNYWKSNFVLFDDYLNAAERNIGDLSIEQKFIELFNEATSKLTKRINLTI
ncbi:MAG: hypothetical protein NTY07_00135 [Bacteroidia bacterium]|nr:hypothetical protein [Bacteroidia bacterium]